MWEEDEDLFQDDCLAERYAIPEEEMLFDEELTEEAGGDGEPHAGAGEPEESLEELCEQAGIDAELLEEMARQGILPQLLAGARQETARRQLESYPQGSLEAQRAEQLTGQGLDPAEAAHRMRLEALEQENAALRRQLDNRAGSLGSLKNTAQSW